MNLLVSWYYHICVLKQSALQNFTLILLVIWHINFILSLITISKKYYNSTEVFFITCFYGSLQMSNKVAFKGIIFKRAFPKKLIYTQKPKIYTFLKHMPLWCFYKTLRSGDNSYFKVMPLQQNNGGYLRSCQASMMKPFCENS